MHSGGILPGGQIHFQAYSLKELIIFAWDLEPDMVAGPSWINSDHFDVVAKTPSPVPLPTVRLMTKSLLMERFQLSVHTEDKDVPVYALIPGKHGPKLKPAGSSSDSGCKFQMIEGTRTYVCRNMTMTGLAERLRDVAPAYLDRPVIDLTTIKGSFDFSLSWMSRGKAQVAVHPGEENQPGGSDIEGPTLFEAISKQLGLELASRKYPLPSLVIDQIRQLSNENGRG